MTLAATALKLAAAAFAMLALAAGTASADGGPIISAGTGCAVQCITKAVVTPTSTTATVELETTVPARLTVSITKQTAGTTTGGLTAQLTKTDHIWAFARHPKASFDGLEPDTTYAIVVKATDLKQQTASQKGTFKTLPFKTQGPWAEHARSGLGCAAECIETALFTQVKPAASIANIDLRTSTEAKIQLIVSRDKPVATAAGPSQFDVVSNQSCPGMTRSWWTRSAASSPELGTGRSYGRRTHKAGCRSGRAPSAPSRHTPWSRCTRSRSSTTETREARASCFLNTCTTGRPPLAETGRRSTMETSSMSRCGGRADPASTCSCRRTATRSSP